MKPACLRGIAALFFALVGAFNAQAQPVAGQPPTLLPQEQGWAYTRTGIASGVYKISDQFAVFPGSRYGFVKGFRVPLDDQDPLHTEAVLQDGQVYVPVSFAGYPTLKEIKPDAPSPAFLRDRWVYQIPRPAYTPPPAVHTLQVNGKTYVDFADVGHALGLHVFEDETGLVCLGEKPDFNYTTHELNIRDATLSAFDTPEKIVDPKIALKYLSNLPALAPMPKPPAIPLTAYNLAGFNFKMLGGKVPPPGVYPRLLFSPEDLPGIQERLKQTNAMQMALAEMDALFAVTWWDKTTPDGQMFLKLAQGEMTEYTGEGKGAGIYSSNVNYPANCLTSMALFCLLSGDEDHGKMAANAIYNYYKALEPKLDKVLAASDNEIAFTPELAGYSTRQWQGVDKLVSGLDAGLALDFAGTWMTPEQKDLMRRVIVKATYGRRPTAGAGLGHLLALAAIEGLPGYDAEGYAADAELARSFLDWGFDEKGQLTAEGAQAGNLQFQLLAMVVLARRNDNLWGHPHWRNFLNGVPTPAPGANSGAAASDGGPYDTQTILEYHAFYPDNTAADRILSQRFPGFNPAKSDLTLFTAQLARESAVHMRQLKLRLPGLSSPGYVQQSLLYDTDWKLPVLGE